jgi:predicted dehydrogenase
VSRARRRALLVGAGAEGRQWIKTLAGSDRWELVGCVEPDAGRRASGAGEAYLPAERCFADLGAAIGRVEADAAFVATPPGTHRGVVCAAIGAGLHVMMEKPLATTWSDGVAILRAARRSQVRVMVNQNRRFGSVARTLARVARSGELGRIAYAQVRFRAHSNQVGNYRAELPHFALLERGVHLFDLVRAVLGREPARVWAKSWNPPWSWSAGDAQALAVFELDGGAQAICFVDWIAHENETNYLGSWTIEGEHAALGSDGERVWISRGPREASNVPLEPSEALDQLALDATLAEFTRALDEGRDPETSVEDSIRSFAMTQAAIEAVESGHAVSFDRYWRDLAS